MDGTIEGDRSSTSRSRSRNAGSGDVFDNEARSLSAISPHIARL
jgi:hypothetical protein